MASLSFVDSLPFDDDLDYLQHFQLELNGDEILADVKIQIARNLSISILSSKAAEIRRLALLLAKV